MAFLAALGGGAGAAGGAGAGAAGAGAAGAGAGGGKILGNTLALARGLFGTASKQQGIGRRRTEFRPEDIQRIEAQRDVFGQRTQGFQNLVDRLAQQAEATDLGPITAFQPGTTLDPLSRSLVSQGQQALLQQAARQRQNIAQQFRQQPGIAKALQAQTSARSVLQQNPLLFQAAQQQAQRELGQAAARLQAEQAANQAILQEQAARQTAASLLGSGLGAQQNLLGTLGQLGQMFGTQINETDQRGRQGGLFAK